MPDFKMGVSTWTFGDQRLEKTAKRLAALGFDGVELLGDLARYSAAEAGRILNDNGLEVFSLTPDNVDIAHPDPTIRDPALDYYFHLIDFAAELGEPLVSCHGMVGRVAPLTTMHQEEDLLTDAVRRIGERAHRSGLRVVFEVLNRYETHQVNTAAQALELIRGVGLDNVGILLDAYHMNIEEPSPSDAIREAGSGLWLYHVADSNRQAVGRGHTDVAGQIKMLREVEYAGPIIIECMVAGPNPFTPDKGDRWRERLEAFLSETRGRLNDY